jgi:hypothetical protein
MVSDVASYAGKPPDKSGLCSSCSRIEKMSLAVENMSLAVDHNGWALDAPLALFPSKDDIDARVQFVRDVALAFPANFKNRAELCDLCAAMWTAYGDHVRANDPSSATGYFAVSSPYSFLLMRCLSNHYPTLSASRLALGLAMTSSSVRLSARVTFSESGRGHSILPRSSVLVDQRTSLCASQHASA